MIPELELEIRAMKAAYEEGCRDYCKNALVDSCPYRWKSRLGNAWRTGWYDSRTSFRLGHIFAKYGIKYP